MDKYTLRNLFKEDKYEDVIKYWNSEKLNEFSEWDFYYLIKSFYKIDQFEKCLEVYKKCHKKIENTKANKPINNCMGWAVYQAKVKNFDFDCGDVPNLLKLIRYVYQNCDDEKSPRWLLAEFLVKAVDDHKLILKNPNEILLEFLHQIDSDKLSREEKKYEEKLLASDFEKWCSEISKVYLNLKRYDKCIDICQKALDSKIKLHSNNDSWFRYRMAKCYLSQNDMENAQNYVREAQIRGCKHWCIKQILFEIAHKMNDEKALVYASECAMADRSHEMRVSFYEDFSKYLQEEKFEHESMLLRHLIILLREENKWKLKPEHSSWVITQEIKSLDKRETLEKLSEFWNKCSKVGKEYYRGTIKNILPQGNAGFIACEDSKDYHFKKNDCRGNWELKKGLKVRFTLEEGFDKKKGQKCMNAVDITLE
jgi:cold shock CspA family protein